MTTKQTFTLNTVLILLLALPLVVLAKSSQWQVDEILKLEEEPAGVVFEIVTGQNQGLEWALPLVNKHIKTLRARFPDLDIAVVTHGREQFALQKDKKGENKKVHSLTQQLVKEGVPVHVCETYAERKGVTAEDFPDFITVAATGPATINDYVAVGYIKVVIKAKTR